MMLVSAAFLSNKGLQVNPRTLPRIYRLFTDWLVGNVHLIESEDIKALNKAMHSVLLDAYVHNWKISVIDSSNSFNPFLLDQYAGDLDTSDILERISLARPFQVLQSLSLVQNVAKDINGPSHLLLAPSFFSLFRQAIEEDSYPGIETVLVQSTRLLQQMAVKGATIILTDNVTQNNPIQSICKIHVRQKRIAENTWLDQLISHPFLPPTEYQFSGNPVRKVPTQQLTLNDFF